MRDDLPLEVRGLSAGYGAVAVLDGVTFEVGPGEVVAVLGGSGTGKTTLLRNIAGLASPEGGSVRVSGRDVVVDGRERIPAERRGVGVVFQEYALFPSMDVADNVGFGLARPDPARVAALLGQLGLAGLQGRRPATLSGGQQQRVALARALAPGPAVLLLDEPFANVDAHRRTQIAEGLADDVRAAGTSALLVTHDRDVALAVADRIIVLVPGPRGAVVARIGAPQAVWADPGTLEVARLTGDADLVAGAIVRPSWVTWADDPAGDQVIERIWFRDGGWRMRVGPAHGPGEVLHVDVETPRTPGTRGRATPSRIWPRLRAIG